MRIQINLNEQTLKRVEEEAKKIGVSRGSMLSTWIGEKINSLDTTQAMLRDFMKDPLTREYAEKLMSQTLKKGD